MPQPQGSGTAFEGEGRALVKFSSGPGVNVSHVCSFQSLLSGPLLHSYSLEISSAEVGFGVPGRSRRQSPGTPRTGPV